jgi:predicted dehydrogenase
MWGQELVRQYGDAVELVGLCDPNPKRVAAARRRIGVDCPTFTRFDEMCDRTRPELLAVTTVDSAHAEYIVKALGRGMDVLTEKPMVTDETQCQAVLDAEKQSGRKVIVTFNYRFAPKHEKIKEILASGAIGRVHSVDFAWYLDIQHGADYFRRWHAFRSKSGTLFVHKASHHFDLVNWYLGVDPVEVTASAALRHYGKNGPFRSTHCRPCPHKKKCSFYDDLTKDPLKMALYAACESADGYYRDGCVFRPEIDSYDTMSALVKYSNGATMAYSLDAFLPYEGHAFSFSGDKGRLDVRDYERQPWQVERKTEIYLTRSFGKRERIDVPDIEGGHAGGDDRLRQVLFGRIAVPPHLALPDARAGAMACLTGIAARKSAEQGGAVIRIRDLVKV